MQQPQQARATVQAKSSDYQVEQISLDLLNKIFEVESARVRFGELDYRVNFQSIGLTLEQFSPLEASNRGDPTLRFIVKAQDGTGTKSWWIDETGRTTPISATLHNTSGSSPYWMSHLTVERLLKYLVDELKIS